MKNQLKNLSKTLIASAALALVAGSAFAEAYYPNRPEIYSLNEHLFLKKIDSLQQPFMKMINKYASPFQTVDKYFIPNEQRDISYFFDRIILDYPYFHENILGIYLFSFFHLHF